MFDEGIKQDLEEEAKKERQERERKVRKRYRAFVAAEGENEFGFFVREIVRLEELLEKLAEKLGE